MKKVIILGGGFAGIEAAIHLRKSSYEVTIISNREYLYIYPTSIWIPVHGASFEQNCIDLAKLSDVHGFDVIIDGVKQINAKDSQVTLQSGKIITEYNHLIIAMGASKMKHKGLENTLSICGEPTLSLEIRDKLDAMVERGYGDICFGFGGNPKDTSAVRGGPAFELLFNTHYYLKNKGIRDKFKLTFFAPMAEPGKRMGENALKMMAKYFKKLDIYEHFGKKIKMFENDSIIFEDDTKLKSDFTMFIPAGAGHDVIGESDLPVSEAGFIKIDDFGNVNFEDNTMPKNIYAIGDITALEGADWRAKQGHIAEVMARNLAHNINEKDNAGTNFKGYSSHINILCVMDSGNGASFIYRDAKKAYMIPMPIFGHWLKKGWGKYFKLSKLGEIPRLPGM